MRTLLGAILFASAVSGQNAQFLPVAHGFVFDEITKSVRPVYGPPGAAFLGPAAVSDVDRAFLSPDGNRAVIRQGDGLFYLPSLGEPGLRQTLELDGGGALDILWTAGSRHLTALHSAGQSFSRFHVTQSGLELTATTEIGPDCRLLAISASGNQTVLRQATGEGVQVLFLDGEQPPRNLGLFDDPVAALIDTPGARILLLDRRAGRLVSFAPDGSALTTPPIGGETGLNDPVGFALTTDRQVLIASGAAQRLFRYSLDDGRQTGEWELDAKPSFLMPMSGTRYLALNSLSQRGDALYAAVAEPDTRIFFIAPQE